MSPTAHFSFTKIVDRYLGAGLSKKEVQASLTSGQRNSIASKPIPSDIQFFFAQFKSPLVLVLLIAAVITALLGDSVDTIVISFAVLINALLGFYQERKAFKSMQALDDVITEEAWVIRDGERARIPSEEIVVGDVVLLYEGDKIPADGVFLEAFDVVVNEAVLTGESVPVAKEVYANKFKYDSFGEVLQQLKKREQSQHTVQHTVKAYLGTTVLTGVGKIVVTNIGIDTEMGHIATIIDEQTHKETPLEKRLNYLAKLITIAVVGLALLIFVFGIATGQQFSEMLIVSVALAVSAIPEGLVVALTAILAIGMHRILKKKALVRNLVATETLGTVTRVCVDKTGTLTEGKLQVTETLFTDTALAYRVAVIANELRDPLEFARLRWAQEYSSAHKNVMAPQVLLDSIRVDERIPFSSERRFLAVRVKSEVFIVGAPETVTQYSTLSSSAKAKVQAQVKTWAQSGKRVIGMGYRKCRSVSEAKRVFTALKESKKSAISIRWVGLFGFTDPVRKGVKEAFESARSAGIAVTVITGDYRETAKAVMAEIGITVLDSQIIDGYELAKMSDVQLAAAVTATQLFARTKPSQKLRIVRALQKNNEVVAMMGDGVNDAPAIAAAEIGLVVGDASDIARESADIVLLDSNFSTILAAVEEGRGIFANLRKILLFLLSDTFSEVILVMGSLFMGWPLAITAAQILWINIVNDVFPNLALTIDPKDDGLLQEKPIKAHEKILNGELLILISVISVITGISTLFVYSWSLPRFGVDVARTLSFALLAIDSLVYVFSCRTLTKNVWEESLFKNPWLVLAVFVSFFATIIPIYFEPFQSFFAFAPLGLVHWKVILVFSLGVTLAIEVIKYIYNNYFVALYKSKV